MGVLEREETLVVVRVQEVLDEALRAGGVDGGEVRVACRDHTTHIGKRGEF